MKKSGLFIFAVVWLSAVVFSQTLPPKQAYPYTVKQIHSGHSLTDPLFHPHYPGQYVNLVGHLTSQSPWTLINTMVGKSTTPGSSLRWRWENPVGHGQPDARQDIENWEVLSITERVPLLYEGGSNQQWYLDGIAEQRNFLSLFVNNAWNNGNNGNGAATLLFTTWVHTDNSSGNFRQMLDIQGAEWERMQDHANNNRPNGSTPVYLIPGHKMMARIYDDIQSNLVPGISNITDIFSDNIHLNELGAYAVSMLHYACLFNNSPVGLPANLIPNAPAGTPIPSQALATYLQTTIWEVVTSYPRTGISGNQVSVNETSPSVEWVVYPNPATDYIFIKQSHGASEKPVDYTVFSLLGQQVLSGTGQTVNINGLPPGQYVIKVENNYLRFIKR